MKKHLPLLIAGAFLFLNAFSVTAQVRFGAKAGLNVAKVDYRVFPGVSPKMLASFQAGALAEFKLPIDLFYLDLGLEVQGKGYQFDSDSTSYKTSSTINPVYVQVPVKLIIRNTDGGVFGGIGTYLAYGVSGKVTEVKEALQEPKKVTTTENIRFGSTNQDHFRPLDYGISIELGYEFNGGIRVTGAYCWGLGDRRKNAVKGTKFISPINHRVASLCVSYYFMTIK